MKNLLLLAVIALGITLISATPPGPKPLPYCSLRVGDSTAGGIVFYLDSTSAVCHGLVCAPFDQGKDIEWGGTDTLVKQLALGGYTDWRMPTKDELNRMYNNLKTVGLGGFGGVNYWSGTENNGTTAWFEHFKFGTQRSCAKDFGFAVRAVRAF